MKERNSEKWIIQGRTEVINNNLNPDFSTFIECDYFFEREQSLRFMVFDIDNEKGDKDFLGKHETSLGKIFGAPK